MISVIPSVNQKCSCYPPTFISPVLLRDKDKLKKFFERQQTRFSSEEVFNEDRLISLSDVFPEHYKDKSDKFLEKAAKDVYHHPKSRIFHARELIQKGLDVGVELTEDEALYTIDSAREKLEKTIDWAKANKKYGRESAHHAVEASVLGTVISACEQTNSFPPSVMIGLKALHGYAQGMRGQKLYGSIYGRVDDDKGIKLYQRDSYGNISGDLAELSCTFETYIKPWVLPFLSVLDSDKIEAIISLLTLPTTSFWRLQYLGFVDQKLGDYLFKLTKNTPPAMFGNKESKKILEEINKSDIASINSLKIYINKTLRLKEGEKASDKLGELFKGLYSSNIQKIEKSATILNEVIAPFIGIAGFCLAVTGIPLRAVATLGFGDSISDSLKRKINAFARTTVSTQNILYSPRFSTLEYVKSKQILEAASRLQSDDPMRKELERNAIERCNVSKIGLIGNAINIFMPFVELIDDSSPFKKILKSVLSETGYGLSQWFFPKRRELRGRLFEEINPELFNPLEEEPLPLESSPPEEPPPEKPRLYRGED